jgi:uncharacterized damage-inducible protein DinB
MTFSNPAGNATVAAADYVQALLQVLGDGDPLTVLGELVAWVSARAETLDEAQLRRPEAPGKWSVMDVLQHLADSDLVMGFRIRMILTEERPVLQGYDQDAWARQFRYIETPLDVTLAQLSGMRAANLRLFHTLTPSQLGRAGMHSERGPETVRHLLRLMAAHDLVHRRQIDRILG